MPVAATEPEFSGLGDSFTLRFMRVGLAILITSYMTANLRTKEQLGNVARV